MTLEDFMVDFYKDNTIVSVKAQELQKLVKEKREAENKLATALNRINSLETKILVMETIKTQEVRLYC